MRSGRAAILALLLAALAAGAIGCAGGEPRSAPAHAAPVAEGPPPEGGHAHDPEGGAPGARDDDDATTHHPFNDPQRWAKVFDDPGRDEWQKPKSVIEAMSIRPGMLVADLGAGTGYFTAHLSRAVGESGMVLAIDPEPEMVKHLGQRARTEGLGNVVPVLGLFEDPFLPRGRVDRVLIVDTYHHIDDRIDYFGRMRGALGPGGRVVVVDFHKRPLPVGPPPEHKLERGAVVDEMTRAGWRLAGESTDLPYQYVLVFAPSPEARPGGPDR